MKNISIALACMVGLLCLCSPPLPAQSFKKGYRKYHKKRDYAAAAAIFQKNTEHPKDGPASRFYLVQMQVGSSNDLPQLFRLDRDLAAADTLFRALPPKTQQRQAKRYALRDTAWLGLRTEVQRKAFALTRVWGTLPVLDSLLVGIPVFLPKVQPAVDSFHLQMVHEALQSRDYAVLTLLRQKHLAWVSPADYGLSRQMGSRIWPLFLEQRGLCQLDRYVRDHPGSFAANDCWWREAQAAVCSADLAQMLDFQMEHPWTVLEYQVIRAAYQLAKTRPVPNLSPAQQQVLDDIRLFFRLTAWARNPEAGSVGDFAAKTEQYVRAYAPRFSAKLLMQEAVQTFLEQKQYDRAVQLLTAARPFFADTLPAFCRSDFDHQKRVRPYIDAVLPILQKPEEPLQQAPVSALNTAEGDEFSPVLPADGSVVYFGAAGRPDNVAGQDVWVAKREKDGWGTPRPVPNLSGAGDQAPLSITADGREMLLWVDGKLHRSTQDVVGKWAVPQPLPAFDLAATGKAVLSPDGRIMALEGALLAGSVLQAPDLDVYIVERGPDGQWGKPVALGADINTDGEEGNMFLLDGGRTLYYTSTGYPGLGMSDVFKAERNGNHWAAWSRPQHLGKAINDTFAHSGFSHVTPDGKRAFFSKSGAEGVARDIWEVVW